MCVHQYNYITVGLPAFNCFSLKDPKITSLAVTAITVELFLGGLSFASTHTIWQRAAFGRPGWDLATALCFPISNPSFGLKKRNSECRSLQVNPRDNVPSLNGPLETTAVPTGDHVRRRSPCLVTLGYLNYSGRYKAHTAQVPLCCTGTISTPGNSWVLPYLHLPRSGLSRPHAWYASGDQRDLRHNCAINERQLLLPRHLNPWRALFRATLLQFYASNFIISIKTQERCSGE